MVQHDSHLHVGVATRVPIPTVALSCLTVSNNKKKTLWPFILKRSMDEWVSAYFTQCKFDTTSRFQQKKKGFLTLLSKTPFGLWRRLHRTFEVPNVSEDCPYILPVIDYINKLGASFQRLFQFRQVLPIDRKRT
jgi:hypothetical protein